MAAEQMRDSQDGQTYSPTRSPKLKKRLITLESNVTSDLTLQESAQIRTLFLTPFLHYQALMAAESVPTKLSVENIRELKKIACPMEELHEPFKNRAEALGAVSGKYHALNIALKSFADQPKNAETQLLAEIQKTYSAYVQTCIEHDEKIARERENVQKDRVAAERAAIQKRHELEEQQNLAEAKEHLRQAITARKAAIEQMLQKLRTSPSDDPVYRQLYSLIDGLTHPQQMLVREIAPELPVETNSFIVIFNKQIESQRDLLYQELTDLEAFDVDRDKKELADIYNYSLAIQRRSAMPGFDLDKKIADVSKGFAALKPVLTHKIVEITKIIDTRTDACDKNANALKNKYQHKKQDRMVLMEADYKRLFDKLGETKTQAISKMFSGSMPSNNALNEKAKSLTKRWWDSVPLINLIPAIKAAHDRRKGSIVSDFSALKRNKAIHDAYAIVIESFPNNITRKHNAINFLKINNAITAIEQTGLMVLPDEKAELLKLEAELNTLHGQLQRSGEIAQLVAQLQHSVAPEAQRRLSHSA